ncbi:acyltransferase [Brevibacillus brevis]|uniref:acyltransferase n=1 Tax=Brevibacillus brevis TaxID=1393 RepID=UPI000D0FDDBC|nr:hypothetical protein C7J99_25420 [Brevibacillus brevis]RED24087.1 surface polysaccharide O-acyltransferase-like enzyme [Brevibacillus brevis]VEF90258.1 Uncharacterized protein conserved in bacteria [Brevibacillus brevis]
MENCCRGPQHREKRRCIHTRIKEIDYLRAISAIAVISIHVTASYVETSVMAFAWNQVARFAVPMFILLSGLSLALSDRGRIGKREFFKRRYNKILLPYLIWSILYFTYAHQYNLGSVEPWVLLTTLGKHMVKGTAYVHLYFLVIICQLYLIYPFLKSLLRTKTNWTLTVSFISTLVMHMAIYLHANQLIVLPSIKVPYVILFPVWVFYFVLGMFVAMRFNEFSAFVGKLTLWQTFVPWFASLIVLVVDSKWTDTFASSTKPSTLLYTVVSALFMYRLSTSMTGWPRKVLHSVCWFSTHSFFIYLIHPLIISELFHFKGLRVGDSGLVMLFILTIVCSCVLAYLGSRFKFVHLFGGVFIRPKLRKEIDTKVDYSN